VPGDKSISHRALILAGLAGGQSRIRGLLRAADVARTAAMMRALGVEVRDAQDVIVRGVGLRGLAEPSDVLDAGNSGTTMRLGAGLLAGQPFFAVMTGDESLRSRPMDRVVSPLAQMGALISARRNGTRAPLCFHGGCLRGFRFELPVPSAQVKSALLLAGLRASGPVTVIEKTLTRDHTERMLRAMGARIEVSGPAVTVAPCDRLDPLDIEVPGDFSSAAFFLALAAARPGASLEVRRVGVNPGRRGLLDVLRRMGAEVTVVSQAEVSGEPVADVLVTGADLRATTVASEEVPSLVDEVPALCVAAVFASGRTEVRGASELRVKESDRISAMVQALGRLGVPCGEFEDGLWIEGPARPRDGVVLATRGDHRVAMALRTLAAAAGVRVSLDDVRCIETSFPDFEATLARCAEALGIG